MKDGVTGLACDLSIVKHLEDVRAVVCEHNDEPADLLKTELLGAVSLGFTLAVSTAGTFYVHKVIPGTSAHLDGGLFAGDQIVSIGGVVLQGYYEAALELLRVPAAVGSKCAVRFRRSGIISEVELQRSPLATVEEAERLFALLEGHMRRVEADAAARPALVESLQLLAENLLLVQRGSLDRERSLARRLRRFQSDILVRVTAAERCLKPLATRPAQEAASPGPPGASDVVGGSSGRRADADAAEVLELVREIESLRAEVAQKTELISLQAQELKRLRARVGLRGNDSPEQPVMPGDVATAVSPAGTKGPLSVGSVVTSPSRDLVTRPPVMSPGSGRYEGKVDIRVVSDVPGAKIYCTRDGSEPTPANFAACGLSPLHIELQHSAVLKCVAVPDAGGAPSAVCAHQYTVDAPAAGVGVLLEISESPAGPLLSVKRLVPGGPAARHGKVQVGDVLEQVDGAPVKGRSLDEVKAAGPCPCVPCHSRPGRLRG